MNNRGSNKQSQDPFRLLVESAPEAIFIQSHGMFRYLNRRMVELFGASSPDELLGTDMFERFAPEYHDLIRSRITLLSSSSLAAPLSEQKYLRMDGSRVSVETTAIPFQYEGHDAVVVFVRDITERLKAEETVRESEERHRRLFENTLTPILVIDVRGNFLDCNDAALQFLETTRPELLERNVADYSPPGREGQVLDENANLWEQGDILETDYYVHGRTKTLALSIRRVAWNGIVSVFAIGNDITERKQVEHEREQYYKLFQNASDLMVIADPGGAFKQVNPACIRTLGYTAEELVGKPFIDFIHSDDRQATVDEVGRLQESLNIVNFENRYVCKDGSVRWLSWRAVYNKQENTIYATARDITELKAAFSEREQFFRFFNTSNDLMCVAGTDGYFKVVNPAWTAILGYSREELLQRPLAEFIHPDDVRSTTQELERQGKGNYTVNFINRYRCKDGSFRWIEWRATPPKENIIYGIGRDLTERKKAEGLLGHMHELMQYVISHAQSAIAVHDRDMKYIYVSEQYLKQYQVKEKDVIGKHHYEVFPDLPQKWRDVHQRVLAGAVEGKAEDPYVRQDGSVEWTRWECRPWYERDGSIGGLIVYTDVITERIRQEQALAASRNMLKQILDTMPQSVFWKDRNCVYLGCNDVFARAVGLTRAEEIVGKTDYDLPWPRTEAEAYRADDREVMEKKLPKRHIIEPLRQADGTGFWIDTSKVPLADKDGAVFGVLGVYEDVTARKKAEEELRESRNLMQAVIEAAPT